MTKSFNKWFASYLNQNEVQVARLLKDETATRFLIAWSIFESDCFSGFVRTQDIDNYAGDISSGPNFNRESFAEILRHFHDRYQDEDRYRNLMHKSADNKLTKILVKDVDSLDGKEIIYFVVYVVYRYRNNIFHGNKGVESWLKYKTQIEYCIEIMQDLIDLTGKSQEKALVFC